MNIFHTLIQTFHRHAGEGQDKTASARTIDSSPSLMGVIMIINFIFLEVLACIGAASAADGVHRCLWMFFAYCSMSLIYKLAAGNKILSNKVFLVTSLAIALHLGIVVMLANYMRSMPEWNYLMILLVPYTLAPIIVSVLLGKAMGTFTAVCGTLFGRILLPNPPPVSPLNYICLSLLTGLIGVVLTGNLRKREQILSTGFFVGIVTFAAAFCLGALGSGDEWFRARNLAWDIGSAIGMSFFVSVFIGGILPLLEHMFHISTPITWQEQGDMNLPLLKDLQLHAPGTFHHSVIVSLLASNAAKAIGANSMQCNVAALYHDIGKTKYPQYFAENIPNSAASPHSELTPDMSAKLIIGHVAEGVELAKKHNLGPSIISIIKEHHGRSLAYYFYRQALDKFEAAMKDFEAGLIDTKPAPVDDEQFRYPGPSPQSREAGIVSLADIVESATRSLKNPSAEEMANKVDELIRERLLSGHLDERNLTLGDIRKVRDSFLETLKTMAHNRPEYPKHDTEPPPKKATA